MPAYLHQIGVEVGWYVGMQMRARACIILKHVRLSTCPASCVAVCPQCDARMHVLIQTDCASSLKRREPLPEGEDKEDDDAAGFFLSFNLTRERRKDEEDKKERKDT